MASSFPPPREDSHRNAALRETLALPDTIARFRDNLRAERSPHTLSAYRTKLSHLATCHDSLVATITAGSRASAALMQI